MRMENDRWLVISVESDKTWLVELPKDGRIEDNEPEAGKMGMREMGKEHTRQDKPRWAEEEGEDWRKQGWNMAAEAQADDDLEIAELLDFRAAVICLYAFKCHCIDERSAIFHSKFERE